MERVRGRRTRWLLLLLVAVTLLGLWLSRHNRELRRQMAEGRQQVWIVDGGVAYQYPEIARAISEAGGRVMIFDFPGASAPSGNRASWARDYGPLAMPSEGDAEWVVWDAVAGGTITPVLENEALVELAAVLGARYERLDLEIQGGNWLLLPDRRVITTTRFREDNRHLSDEEIDAVLRSEGIVELIEISPLPGELTRHADMVVSVHPRTGEVFVGSLAPAAIDLIPDDPGAEQYRRIAEAMQESLDRTYRELRSKLGAERVFRFPQPLPYLDRHPVDDRYRPNFPSFVNGIFVIDESGATTYLYGLARNDAGEHFYSFDVVLLDEYVAQVDRLARERGFVARGVEVGDLITHGGSVHCATVEGYLYSVPERTTSAGP